MPETNFYWDPIEDNIVREYDEAGVVTAEYTTEPDLYGNVISQRRQGEYGQFHFDSQGSTLAATDENQSITDTFAYTAFGEVTERTGTTGVPFQYVGRRGYYRDSLSGQNVVRRRIYLAATSRWLTVDPLRMISLGEGTPYAYVGNKPASLEDPSGEQASVCCQLCAETAGALAIITLNLSQFDRTDDIKGGNAMQHCWANCYTAKNCGESCRHDYWDARESPFDAAGRTVRLTDLMDLRNNQQGASCGTHVPGLESGCWDCCLAALRAGLLTCLNENLDQVVPCPSDERL